MAASGGLYQLDATSDFFHWWFEAWGIGGWVIFLLLDIAVIAWLIYDSSNRRIRATGWLLGAILPALLLLPSALFGFAPATRTQMQDLQEVFFYLGLIGGIVPIVVVVGYYITYRGMRGCEKGHVYEASLADCPICAQDRARPASVPVPAPAPRSDQAAASPPPRDRPKANAWLVDEGTNRNYQLYRGDTRIGRRKEANDIVFADKAISREHVLIREERGHYTIYDRGASTGTYVNGRRVEGPMLLAHDDVIELGDTRLRFMTSR